METLYIMSIFSLIGFFGVIGYLFWQDMQTNSNRYEYLELLEERITHLENYLYDLEEKVTPISSDTKEKIIGMYREGKDIMVMENSLNIPKTKIEMILKEYEQNNRY
ncbi:MAG TPA: hypothetical protein ENK99_03205 [Campylobacterales bacterium]|nr:hypothetical protein [Campylobacterales bacterium]HHH51275.1 hypothetical protein [Campylobacterales bacterium]